MRKIYIVVQQNEDGERENLYSFQNKKDAETCAVRLNDLYHQEYVVEDLDLLPSWEALKEKMEY